MEINRKSAMKIWEEQFGGGVSAVDFAGRRIQKGAYGQRTSSFGWELVHILPKTEGGKTEPSNLICVHVRTADEKSDLFPSFKANEVSYVISESEGVWSIDVSNDITAIAEQEAKTLAAMQYWDNMFGAEAERAEDFAGREMIKADYGTENPGAWKTAYYVASKPMDDKNTYIANIATVEEAFERTAFKANGKQFSLNKDNGSYFFREVVPKPAQKQFSVGDYTDVSEYIDRATAEFSAPENTHVWLDFITVKVLTAPAAAQYIPGALTDTVSMILREQAGMWLSSEVSEMSEEDGTRHIFITYRFASPKTSDLERIFGAAMLINTYAELIMRKFGLRQFKIYNYANRFETSQLHYSVGMLAAHNPEYKSLMTNIYQSEKGFYENENANTLYVSQFIVYNIPALSEIHGENTVYHTEANMVEHNFVYPDVVPPSEAESGSEEQ